MQILFTAKYARLALEFGTQGDGEDDGEFVALDGDFAVADALDCSCGECKATMRFGFQP